MTRPDPDPFSGLLAQARAALDLISLDLASWAARSEPDSHARRSASDAIEAIDEATGALSRIRTSLISQIRASDSQAADRADALLAQTRRGSGHG